jgi:serine/threonine protein phosphatase 1
VSGPVARALVRLGLRVPAPDLPEPRPEAPIYAVGDVHGRPDLLLHLLDRIEADARVRCAESVARLVMLGDYVDRGDDPRGALSILTGPEGRRLAETVCLMGNHERMMLDALDAPAEAGRRWLRHGGDRTLLSFGVAEDDPEAALPALRNALPAGMEEWLRSLPLTFRSGDVVCVHAALDPDAPPEAQDPQVMLFGHPRFARRARGDGLWVVHGHTVVFEAVAEGGRVACDTGAYYSDRLSAAALYPGEPARFLTAES